MASVTATVRCPPFCKADCEVTHHPLLVAVLNAVDTDDADLMNERIGALEETFQKYAEDIHEDIQDENEQYRFPPGHWACALGRVSVLSWLLSQGMEATAQCGPTKDTMLHKALTSLQQTIPVEAAAKFRQMIPLLEESLCVEDALGFTILHTCCDMLRKDLPRADFFLTSLRNLVACASSQGFDFLLKFVNAQTGDGNTAMHILAKSSSKHITAAEVLVDAGCDLSAVNKEGLTPLEVALDMGLSKMGMFLNSEMNKRKKNLPSTHPNASQVPSANSSGDEPNRAMSEEESLTILEQRRKKAIMKSDSVKVTSRVGALTDVSHPDGSIKWIQFSERRGIHVIPDGATSMSTKSESSDSDEDLNYGTDLEKAYVTTKEGINIPLQVKGTSFLEFIKGCDSKRKESVYQSLAEEKFNCENSITSIDQKYLDVKDKLEETQSRQKRSVDSIQNLLWKLNQLQEEEGKLTSSIKKSQKDQEVTHVTLKGLKERLQHCQAALDALHGLG